MAQPRSYSITTNFNDYTTTNPSDPHPGSKFDTEFTEIKQNLDDLNTNIALLQRDDGKLKNEAVHKDGFDQDSLALIGLSGYTVRGAWAAATAYAVGDIITNNDATYLNSTAHTSTTFANDTANWTLLANAAINVTGHEVDTLNGRGVINLQGASWSSGAAVIAYTSDIGTPAVGHHITHAGFPAGTKIQSIDTSSDPKTVTADTNSTASGTAQVVDLGRGFTTNFSYSSNTDYQVYVANQLVLPSTYSVSGTTLTFDTAPAAGTDNVVVWGGGVAVEAAKTHVTTYRDDALDHRDTAADYATRTDGVVRHFDGATGNASDSSPSDQSGVYSAKAWAMSTDSNAPTDGSAKQWARTTGVVVADSEYSAKEYAIGTTVAVGSAKDWAVQAEDSVVTGSSYSALHHAAKAAADRLATAADVVSTNADVVSTNADAVTVQGIYDQFDDRYLGVKSSDPTVDNDGATLLDGALYFNTTNNVMMVYDLGNTTWVRTTPTTTDQGHINTVSGIAANVTTVAGISGNVTTVAGIDDKVTTVAGSQANVNTVAGSIADVNRYANEYKIAASAPGSPSEGDMWSDTSNNVFKVYNGTAWETVTGGQTEAEVNGTAISMAIALG